MTREKAYQLRKIIEKAVISLTDEDALEAVVLYPEWNGGLFVYEVGDRVRYNGELYKVLQHHTSQMDWNPEASPSLFARVLTGETPEDIRDWEQPDSTNPYMTGDRVRFEGQIYESVIDNNIWSPASYPAGWTLITE